MSSENYYVYEVMCEAADNGEPDFRIGLYATEELAKAAVKQDAADFDEPREDHYHVHPVLVRVVL